MLRKLASALLAAATVLAIAPQPAEAHRPLTARNLPSGGRVLFYMGQDSTTLHDLKTDVLDTDRRFPRPAGVTLYTNLVGSPMSGMFQPTDYGSGENDFPATINEFGGGLAVGLYLSDPAQTPLKAYAGTADAATVARYREWLDEFLTYLDRTGRDVFLRIGYEFDGAWNAYDPELYKQAYRYIARRIDQLGARRIATVWQSAAWPRVEKEPFATTAAGHWDRWYPGDDYVDWAGLSHFYGEQFDRYQWGCEKPENIATTPIRVQQSLLDFARKHRKPVFISESAPQGFDNGAKTAGCIFVDPATGGPHPTVKVTAQQIWDTWYAPYFRFVERNRDVIRGIAYINTDWKSQSMWNCRPGACANGYWGDSRVQADPLILARFRAEISKPMYEQGPRWSRPFEAPDFSGPIRSEGEYADLPQGGTTGIAIADTTASNDRTALIYANGASLEFDHVTSGRTLGLRYATTTDNVRLTVLVNGAERHSVALPNRGAATNWADVTLPVAIPRDATVTLRLDSGDVVWIDYITPGQSRRS
ncbi:carbohydrate-binding domain-containing protein [Actinoplanes sp. CA-054009]